MFMLHILTHSPFKCDYFSFLKMLKTKDEVLLIQDGVIAALQNTKINKKILRTNVHKIFVLYNDISARGFNKKIEKTIKIVNYSGFVKLVIKHCNQITW